MTAVLIQGRGRGGGRPPTYPTIWARLMANSRPVPCPNPDWKGGPCWEWTGAVGTGHGRYPQINIRVTVNLPGRLPFKRVKTQRAHRLIASIVLGRDLAPEETIEHDCLYTKCICPDHFLLATNSDNASSARARHTGRTDEAKARMVPLRPVSAENPPAGRFWHYAEPIPI